MTNQNISMKNLIASGILIITLMATAFLGMKFNGNKIPNPWLSALAIISQNQTTVVNVPLFTYLFDSVGTLNEAGSMTVSTSPYWWVNSGAQLVLSAGTGKTIQGSLPENDKWRKLYATANPTDTDNGYHPQNIFRLITKGMWHNYTQQSYFKINNYILSDSPNRSESNGLLLFNRYVDSQNLYYTGVRVDGTAVIKKKKGSTYYTLAQQKIFPGTYNRATSPNLIPTKKWIGVRSEVSTTSDHKVSIKVYTDVGKTGVWKLVASAIDDGLKSNGIIDNRASAGIRTDFMDVEFNDYRIEEIQ